MTDKEKIAALEARIRELETMPGDAEVSEALRWAQGADVHVGTVPFDVVRYERNQAKVLARALTATRAELEKAKKELFGGTDYYAELWNKCEAAEKELAERIVKHDKTIDALAAQVDMTEKSEKERDELRAALERARSNLSYWMIQMGDPQRGSLNSQILFGVKDILASLPPPLSAPSSEAK